MKPIRIDTLAARLDRDIDLSFSPLIEDPNKLGTSMRNPKPWTCSTVDFVRDRGTGATPEEACGALVEAMVLRARRRLAAKTDSQRNASAHLEEMIALLSGA